jgi:hypothetical protein
MSRVQQPRYATCRAGQLVDRTDDSGRPDPTERPRKPGDVAVRARSGHARCVGRGDGFELDASSVDL